ncbi:MAG: twin-arginine translocase subunit TatC [Alphaproteobacteria bacterium]|nr:twin-arginine translocase subunit TatC [Alphaproteobacteria bacterium]
MTSELDDSRMPLIDHLVELRARLLWSIAALAVAFAVCLFFVKPIYEMLLQPLKHAGQNKLIYTNVFEGFFTQLKVAFFAALMLAFPFISNQLWRFVAPGLYAHEKNAFRPFLIMTPVLFTMGACLAYFVAMPIALHYLLSYQGNIGGISQEALPSVGNYLSFSTTFLFGFGVAFQLPVVLMIAERAGFVTRQQLVKGRRYAIVASTGLAALLTPPDAISMFLLAVPLVILYEFALVVIWFTQRRRAALKTGENAND